MKSKIVNLSEIKANRTFSLSAEDYINDTEPMPETLVESDVLRVESKELGAFPSVQSVKLTDEMIEYVKSDGEHTQAIIGVDWGNPDGDKTATYFNHTGVGKSRIIDTSHPNIGQSVEHLKESLEAWSKRMKEMGFFTVNTEYMEKVRKQYQAMFLGIRRTNCFHMPDLDAPISSRIESKHYRNGKTMQLFHMMNKWIMEDNATYEIRKEGIRFTRNEEEILIVTDHPRQFLSRFDTYRKALTRKDSL